MQAAQVGDLDLQFMAFAVDDLHVLPRDLVLFALTVVQKVQRIHLLLHRRFFEKLSLQIEQCQAIQLGQQRRRNHRRRLQPNAQTGMQRKKLKDKHHTQQPRTA